MEVNAIMGQLDELDGNGHGRKTIINHFAPLFESGGEGYTKYRMKLKTEIILLSEYEEGRKNKGEKTRAMNNMKSTGKIIPQQRWTTLTVTTN